jgi:hypothetical protein
MIQNKNNIEGKILAIEMELSLCDADLDVLTMDMYYFKDLLDTLKYNYNFLKKETIVVMMYQYRKTIIEMGAVETKVISVKNQMDKVNKSIDAKVKTLEYLYEELERKNELEKFKILQFKRRDDESK